MTPREQRIAEAVRDACVAEFQTRADEMREMASRFSPTVQERTAEIARGLEANAALLRALDVAAVVAKVE